MFLLIGIGAQKHVEMQIIIYALYLTIRLKPEISLKSKITIRISIKLEILHEIVLEL